MRALARLLLRLVCSLALLFSALPIRAGVVCIEGGRVVATCRMTSLPEAAASPSAASRPQMACCRARAAGAAVARPSRSCRAHQKTRCAYAYRSGAKTVIDAKAALSPPTPETVADLASAFVLSPIESLAGSCEAVFASDPDPPRSRLRAPDRGRAPPVV